MSKINLTEAVTILAVDCITPKLAIKAIEFSCRGIDFQEALLFTDEDIQHDWIKIVKINKINSTQEYSKFMINELPYLIGDNVPYILVVQADGFVINPHLWDDYFCLCDYIGAPWDLNGCRIWKKKSRIGNGGFSLRSRRLLDRLKEVKDYDGKIPEDSFISDFIWADNQHWPLKDDTLHGAGIDFAVKFAVECPLEDYPFDLSKVFGFHGKQIYDNLDTLYPELFNEN